MSMMCEPQKGSPDAAQTPEDDAGTSKRLSPQLEARLNESQLRALLDSLPNLLWTLLPEGPCDYLSPQWIAYTGTLEADLLGDGWLRQLHPDDRERVQAEWAASVGRGAALYTELRIRRSDGVYRWFRAQIVRCPSAPGEVAKWYGSAADVEDDALTERSLKERGEPLTIEAQRVEEAARTQADEAQRKSDALLRSVFDAMGEGIVLQDTSGRITACNQAAEHILGLTKSQLEGRTSIDPRWRSIYEDGSPFPGEDHPSMVALRVGERQSNVIMGVHRPDGQLTWISINAEPIFGPEGLVASAVTTFIDITARKDAVEALRESEQRWKFALEGTGDGVWDWDVPTSAVWFSGPFQSMLGYAEDELSGHLYAWASRVHPEDFSRVMADLQQHLDGETTAYVNEHRVRCKDGSYKWILDRGLVITRDADGKPRRMVGTHEDITPRKQAEAALREREQEYRALFEASPIPLALNDNAGRIIALNAAFVQTFGYTTADVPTITAWWPKAYPDPTYRARVIGTWQERMEKSARDKTAFEPIELTIRCQDDTQRTVLANTANLGKHSTNIHLVVLYDITERKQAEESLRLSNQLLEASQSIAKVGGWELNLITQKLFWTAETYRIHDTSPAEFKPTVSAGVGYFLPESRRVISAALNAAMERGEGYDLILETLTTKGRRIDVRTTCEVTIRDGRPVTLSGIFQDITERKQAEAEKERLHTQLLQSQKMEAIGTLAGGIAHDFNNILAGLLSGLSLLELEPSTPAEREADITDMKALVARGAHLIRELLGFARRGKYDVKPLDLGSIAQKTLALFSSTRRDITFHLDLAPRLSPVLMDHTQMEQVLLNLFVNASQAMEGGGQLLLRVEDAQLEPEDTAPHSAASGHFVKITITDTGAGMDAATRARIFEPFFTTKASEKGTGLGLASVYGIIKSYQGFIEVESTLGAGSTFRIFLPASGEPTTAEKPKAGTVQRGKGTILVVDDEAMILKSSARLLKMMGYDVLTAQGGQEAIQLLKQHKESISLVILDLTMPKMSGTSTYKAIREVTQDVKVLLSSGYSIEGQAQALLEQGCSGFIQKPFDTSTLSAKVAALF
jgi:two-component system, cell cycle sensor histidine kinase and response regulator CckA